MAHIFWSSCITLAKRSGLFSQLAIEIPHDKKEDVEFLWRAWIQEEVAKRLAQIMFAVDVERMSTSLSPPESERSLISPPFCSVRRRFLPSFPYSLGFPSSAATPLRRGPLGRPECSRMETTQRRSSTSDPVHLGSQGMSYGYSRPTELEPFLEDRGSSWTAERLSGSALVRFAAVL